jgi:D-sedoheptulose 7-phosphate isomerase
MQELDDRVRYLFGEDISLRISQVDLISGDIAKASQRLVDCLLNDGKMFIGGSGGSSGNCLHFSASMLNNLHVERPPLPIINLTSDISTITAITSEGNCSNIFSRQIQALGNNRDVLIVLTTTGNSNIILDAINTAHDCGMDVITLNGRDGGLIANHLGPDDIEIRVQANSLIKIREMHLFILHCFGDLIDRALFGQVE